MNEEARVFARTAIYALGIAAVYWFVSYEVSGTVMLVALGVAAGALTAMLPGRSQRTGRRRITQIPRALVTFGEDDEPALEIEEVPLPTLSLQPFFVSLGATGVTLGLVFGAWLWLPGALVLAGAAWAWSTELDS